MHQKDIEQLFDSSPQKRKRTSHGDPSLDDPEDVARRMLERYIADADWATQGSNRISFGAGKWWHETGIGRVGKPLYVVFCSVTGTMNTS